MAQNYILRVTAGPEYEVSTHQVVPVNTATPITLESDLCSVSLNVRIENYRGLPHASPSTSAYFELEEHKKAHDSYSIGFRFTPKVAVNGSDLRFGNDFDHSIRERLPPLAGTALKVLKGFVDPGLEGDIYADQPYLYGPLGSSIPKLWVEGGKEGEAKMGENGEGLIVEEGGDEEGMEIRRNFGMPDEESARKKFFLKHCAQWEWEVGKTYGCDFYNSMLDFNCKCSNLEEECAIPERC
jgi:hypothetical protein